jgi:two-component system nitrogen regulation response regulator GlnG
MIAAADVETAIGAAPAAPAPPSDAGIEQAVRALLVRIEREEPGRLDDGTLYDRLIAEVERPLIEATLRRHGGNQLRAARALGINRNTLRKRLDTLGIEPR